MGTLQIFSTLCNEHVFLIIKSCKLYSTTSISTVEAIKLINNNLTEARSHKRPRGSSANSK